MAFFVYILHCSDGSYYTGHSDNLERRIHEHQAGAISSCYTFKRRPLQLVFSQDFPTREEALSAEQQIKGWSRKKKEAMMRGDWAEVPRLARSSSTNQDGNAVRPALNQDFNAVPPAPTTQDFNAVRPEPVEGCGCVGSIHGSTSSPRTEGALL